MTKVTHLGFAMLSLLGLGVGLAAGDPIYLLSHRNSTAAFDLGSQAGQYSWTVDGTPQLAQQWFWYRIGNNNPEASFDTISAPVVIQPLANFLSATYTQPGNFSATVSLFLTGGQPGSGTSDITEAITIDNISAGPLEFHLFQYVNLDLNGSAQGDTVQFLAPNTVRQTKGSAIVTETVVTPSSGHHEAAFFPQTRNSLNDGLPTTLNDNSGPLGPGDVTWAFEWDVTLAPGGSLIVSKDKQITIPEPTTALLLILGVAAIGARRSRG